MSATGAAGACAQCGTALAAGEGIDAGDRRFCARCYEGLAHHVRGLVDQMGSGINWPAAFLGAIVGGAVGAVGFYLFTVAMKGGWGLIALAIGYAAGKGIQIATGGKRSVGLQALAAVVSFVAFVAATLAVNSHSQGPEGMFAFNLMDLVFGAITVWEAWAMPRPVAVA